jgi:hydrogenase expression/formation protein HypC
MCLAIPGKIIEISREAGLKMGRIDYGGTINRACLEYVPDAAVGQYALVHAGFAISVLDEEEAEKSLAVWQELQERVGSL